jgi:predicted RNA-binding protein YlqC (UPF0109 family)
LLRAEGREKRGRERTEEEKDTGKGYGRAGRTIEAIEGGREDGVKG